MAAQAFDVCIRGSGIVGRTLALLLARAGVQVALVESPPPAQADIRAYALNHASRHLLQSVRCWPQDPHVTAVQRMQIQGDGSGHVGFDAPTLADEAMMWIADVPALEAQLQQACQYQPHITTLPAETGDTPAADLTVICEGRHSATRAGLGVTYHTWPYSQQAIATRITLAAPHGQTAWQWFGHDGHDSGILAFLPTGGAQGSEAAVVWSLPVARAQHMQGLPDADFLLALNMAARSSGTHAPSPLAVGVQQRVAWPLQQGLAQQWAGRWPQQPARSWVLAGDAAHSVHPLAGQGLNLGLADAAQLAQLLGQRATWRSAADWHLLRQYERARKASLRPMMLGMDGIQRLFSHTAPAVRTLRNWGMDAFTRSGPLKQWIAQQATQSPHQMP